MAQCLDRICVAHYFNLLKNTSSEPQIFVHGWGGGGIQLKHKIFNKTLLFCVYKNKSHYKHKNCLRAVIYSFDPFQFYMKKKSVPSYFYLVTCIPRKVIRHMASDFKVSEANQGMQMNILNAAPWPIHSFIRGLSRSVNSSTPTHVTSFHKTTYGQMLFSSCNTKEYKGLPANEHCNGYNSRLTESWRKSCAGTHPHSHPMKIQYAA